jgi:large subunit ribosomal protein L4
MPDLKLCSQLGADLGTVPADARWFGITPNIPVMHQVVTAQLAARRSGTQSTLTRAEVNRSSKKARRQKGGGTSRQGSMRGPQWVGGGVALGPKPRKYNERTPKKMINLALRSALSDRASDGRVVVIDSFTGAAPKTKDGVKALAAMGIEKRVLVVLDASNEAESLGGKALRNIPNVQLIEAGELNAYDVLLNDWIVFSKGTLPGDSTNTAVGSKA